MKYNGCKAEYRDERALALLHAYHEYLHSHSHINVDEAARAIVKMPTRRFYVSWERAYTVISYMMRGDELRSMRATKRAMFQEIYRRVLSLKDEPEWQGESVCSIVQHVVSRPAPEFYISAASAKVYIYSAKQLWHQKKLLKWRRWQ
jgi:hypothetical protein